MNMSLLVDYINNELVPDLAVNTGDVVILNPDSAEDRETAHEFHRRIEAPMRVLPGNHDVGESADHPWMNISVTSQRIAGFWRTWGPDRFLEFGGVATGSENWAFIGLNSERFSSGLPEEDEQWDWLSSASDKVAGKSLILFLHKPLWYHGGARAGITVTEDDRERLISVLAGARLRVVANGHVHRYRQDYDGEVLGVWAPSLAFTSPPDPVSGFPPSPSGIVEYHINGDDVEVNYRSVPGVRGAEDILTMPEVVSAMAELESSANPAQQG
jgi:3',5'-cyclic AMP phosphodiesterase CpdA